MNPQSSAGIVSLSGPGQGVVCPVVFNPDHHGSGFTLECPAVDLHGVIFVIPPGNLPGDGVGVVVEIACLDAVLGVGTGAPAVAAFDDAAVDGIEAGHPLGRLYHEAVVADFDGAGVAGNGGSQEGKGGGGEAEEADCFDEG